MKTIDLHTHTAASDGTYTPEELIDYADKKGLAAIAVTDHDTTEGVEAALKAGEGRELQVISGIEISSLYDNIEIHLVGLFIDYKSPKLLSELEALKECRESRNQRMVDRLRELNINITLKELKDFAGGGIITRAHFAKVMANKGYVSSANEAFNRYLGSRCPGYVPRELPCYEASINMIREAGGIAVLAHPLLYKINESGLNTMLSKLKASGLTAIEAYYSTHSLSDTIKIKQLAKEKGLLLSGGSDFHGGNKKGLDLGTGYGKLAVPYRLLEKLKGGLKNG